MSGRDWGGVLRHAVGAFGMMPDAVWQLSVAEWRMLTAGAVTPLGNAELGELMRAFPDGAGPPSGPSGHLPPMGEGKT
jgi:uncharacterized phage protein (TIGR02216 family)